MLDLNPGLLSAICANPADDMPRLMMADWLEDNAQGQDDVDRAAFIRLQIETAKVLPADMEATFGMGNISSYMRISDLSHDLNPPSGMIADNLRIAANCLNKYWNNWTEAVTRELHPVFRRGFIDRILCSTQHWQNYWTLFVKNFPLTNVWLTGQINLSQRFNQQTRRYDYTIEGCHPWRFMIDERELYSYPDVRDREQFIATKTYQAFQQMCPHINFQFDTWPLPRRPSYLSTQPTLRQSSVTM